MWDRHININASMMNIFGGQFRSTVTCNCCGNESFCFDPFYDLSLPLSQSFHSISRATKRRMTSGYGMRRTGRDQSCLTITDCLNSFVEEEALSRSDKTFCSRCWKKQESTRSLRLERLPQVLVLHLKRFNNARRKQNTKVEFPLVGLDLSDFVAENSHAERDCAYGQRRSIYDLVSVCHHSGSMNYGHYVASCLDEGSGEWYEYNDDCVTQLDSPEEMTPCNTPYVLFYKLR